MVKHIDCMCAKMGKAITVIKRYVKFLTCKTTTIVAQSLILSNLDYCPTVWSNATAEKIRKLWIIQNGAARMVLRCDYYTSTKLMHAKLNWMSVYDRLSYSLLTFVRNISVTKTPQTLYQNLLFSVDIHKSATRHACANKFISPITEREHSVLEQCRNGTYSPNK